MSSRRSRLILILTLLPFCITLVPAQDHPLPDRIEFNRDIRPILSENCYACHGPDKNKREAELRLDIESGARTVLHADPQKSKLIQRITAADPDERMPPVDSGKTLTRREIELIRRWIRQGAEWQQHWAYLPPRRPAAPKVRDAAWPRSVIDRFILARLEKEKLAPAKDADRITLIRRLSFDLTGLPPTVEEVDHFLNDRRPDATERLVERLFASPHHGERLAVTWLDLVRFADTRGVHSDNPRNVAPYRDYVIDAFNQNMGFDQFTIEQLAGDLVPGSGLSQKIASCYNKLNLTTEEGGSQPKEFEIRANADRVRNVSSVWLGSTLECAECHDHKFDPFSTKDFYRLSAFFADIKEKAIMDKDSGIPLPDKNQAEALASYGKEIARLRKSLTTPTPELDEAQVRWEEDLLKNGAPVVGDWHSVGPFQGANAKEAFEKAFPPEKEIDLEKEYGELKWIARPKWTDGKIHKLKGDNSATYLTRTIEVASERTLDLSLGSDDGIKVWVNGEIVLSKEVYRGVAPNQERVKIALQEGTNTLLLKVHNGGGGYGFYFKLLGAVPPKTILAILEAPAEARDPRQEKELGEYFLSVTPLLEPVRKELAATQKKKAALEKVLSRCLVTTAAKPRTVRIRPRGDWMDDSGAVVTPAVPHFLKQLETGDRRATRLDLARWLVSRENPLTARVFVNRLWKLFYGTGLSSNLEDVGSQGEWPVHPELIDWLAVEFMDHGWDIRHIIRLMVTSRTYRLSSVPTGEQKRRDPLNRLYARQARFRLDAEMIRDNALAISGLLSRRIGGPSVKPHQPPAYWEHLNFPKRKWTPDKGEDTHRRGLYTWIQRTFLHPAKMAFDAPNRERCMAERPRSNIPQQALVLLNDPTYVEAARAFAERVLRDGGKTTDERIRWAWRQALSRHPDKEEIRILSNLLARQESELDGWTSVTRALLNLHETITRN